MGGKIIDIDPSRRLSEEALAIIKAVVADLRLDETKSLTIIYTPIDGGTSVQAFGLDFAAIGVASIVLNTLGQELLKEEFEISEPVE